VKGYFLRAFPKSKEKFMKTIDALNIFVDGTIAVAIYKIHVFDSDEGLLLFIETSWAAQNFGWLSRKIVTWGFKKRLKKDGVECELSKCDEGEGALEILRWLEKARQK
jgi:hypothetical protein